MDCHCNYQTSFIQNIFIFISTLCIFYTGFSIISAIFGAPKWFYDIKNYFKPFCDRTRLRCRTCFDFINSIFSSNRPAVRLIIDRKNGKFQEVNLLVGSQSARTRGPLKLYRSPILHEVIVLEEMKLKHDSVEDHISDDLKPETTYVKLDDELDHPLASDSFNRLPTLFEKPEQELSEESILYDVTMTSSDPAWRSELLNYSTPKIEDEKIHPASCSPVLMKRSDNHLDDSVDSTTSNQSENNNNYKNNSLQKIENSIESFELTSVTELHLTTQPLSSDEEFEKVNYNQTDNIVNQLIVDK